MTFNSVARLYDEMQPGYPPDLIEDMLQLSDNRKRLFDGIVSLIDGRYDGRILKHYEAILDLRRKRCDERDRV